MNSIEIHAYRMSKDLVSEEEEIKCNNAIKQWKIINFDDVSKENIKNTIPMGYKFLIIHAEY